MRIDQTHIAIRERGTLELFDLALQVLRRYAPAVLACAAVGSIPFAMFNAWLLDPLLEPSAEGEMRYAWLMTVMVVLQAPLASSLITLYLGQALFVDRPSLRQMLRDLRRMAGQLLYTLGLLRGVAPTMLLMMTASLTWDMTGQEFLLVCVAIYVLIVRTARPFLGEIVLLEHNPWKKSKRRPMTTRRRSASLHSSSGSDFYLGYGLVAPCAGLVLAASLWLTSWFLRSRLGNVVEFDYAHYALWLPAALWLTNAYLSVVRFLTYLDVRIRHEGWEVELQMRAVGAELAD